MYPLALVGFAIAFAATAGAIPLFRSWREHWKPLPPGAEAPAAGAPPLAGAAMLFGLFLALFYLDVGPAHLVDLLTGGMLLAVVGQWLERWQRKRTSRGVSVPYELAVSVMAGLALMVPLLRSDVAWSAGAIVFAGMVTLAPVSLSHLSRSARATSGLPAGVGLVQLLLLALFGVFAANGDVAAEVRYEGFSIVILPAIGAIIAALVYLCRMPWRPQAAITAGVAARLCLGLLVAWGALKLAGADAATLHANAPALAWALAVPVFELLRRYLGALVTHLRLRLVRAGKRDLLHSDHSPVSITAFALVLGAIGLGLWQLRLTETWSIILLVPAFVLYCAWPHLLGTSRVAQQSGMIDARG